MSERAIRLRRAGDRIFAAAALVAVGLYLWLGGGLAFNLDEWTIIRVADRWGLDDLMRPVNEHWALGLRLIWNSLMATVGLRSYVPYLAVDIAFNVAIATGLYVFARTRVHPLLAASVGILFLFLGSGSESWFLAFQLGWTGAAAAGTWALVLLLAEPTPGSRATISLLLLVAVVMFSSVGLFFVAAVGAVILVSRRHRRHWPVIVPAVVAFGAWFLAYGRDLAGAIPDPPRILEYMQDGIAYAVGQVSGAGSDIGLVLAVLLGVATVANLVSHEPLRLGLIAAAAGLIAQWGLIGIGRADDPSGAAFIPRYVHIAAIFILLGVVSWLAHRRLGAPGLRLRSAVAAMAVLGLALGWNVSAILWFHGAWDDRAEQHRAAIAVVLDHGGTPALPADVGLAYGRGVVLTRAAEPGPHAFLPGATGLRALFDRYGSPLEDLLAPRGTDVPPAAYDRAFADIIGGELSIEPAGVWTAGAPLEADRTTDLEVETDGPCLVSVPAGPEPTLDLTAPSGATLVVTASAEQTGSLTISRHATFAGTSLPLEAGADYVAVRLPDIGAVESVRVRLALPAPARVCLAAEAGITGRSNDGTAA